jgi:PAS domain S-box-containing protein
LHSQAGGSPSTPDLSTLRFARGDGEGAFLRHPAPSLLYEPETRRIVAANPAAAALYGWPRESLAGMTLDDLHPPDQRERLASELAATEQGGRAPWLRTVQWRRDGERLEIEWLTQPMELDGRPVRRASLRDVTGRERAEALFRGVAEQSLTGICVLQDERFVYVNPRLAEMFGYTTQQVLADPDPLRFLGPTARAEAARHMAGRLSGDGTQVRYTLETRRRDGRPVVVEIHGSSLVLGGRLALLGTVLDVTARVANDHALLASERRFRAAFDQAMTGMSLTAPDGRWLRVNPALCEMLGYTPDEMVALTFPALTHPDDLPRNLALRDALLAGEIPGYRMEKRFLHKDGSLVWVALNVSLVRDDAGAPLYMLAQMTDITARKRAESALHDSEAQLRHAQKMEAVGRLAGGVAHDFNNLLTVIGSNAEMGADLAREGRAAPEEFSEIRSAVERAAALTRQLLAFSRRQVLAPEPLPLNQLVSDAERMLRRVIGEDVVLETRLDARVGEVVADRGQLEQVLMNLVVNARDAMPEGGRVVITTSCGADGQVQVCVSDTGVGMDRDTQSRAFEPFFTTKEPGKGTGLGLSTVYGIARQSGGDVSIDSQVGVGTTITLHLPHHRLSEAAGRAVPLAPLPPGAGAGQGETILLVEDEAAVRTVVRRILSRAGYRVLEAGHGGEALDLWAAHRSRIAMVLTDAVMPVMGGLELADRLHADGAEIPVLYMSGYADGERGGEIPLGADLIGKPFTAESLSERVAAVLAHRPARVPPRAAHPGALGS